MGDAVRLLAQPLASSLDAKLLDDAKTRRAAWSEMFRAGHDSCARTGAGTEPDAFRGHESLPLASRGGRHRSARMRGRGSRAKRYLYEALGLQPWLGADTENGPNKQWGANYFQITGQGLSREKLGYVGGYGEILSEMVDVFEAVREAARKATRRSKAQIRETPARAALLPLSDAGRGRLPRHASRDRHRLARLHIAYSTSPTRSGAASTRRRFTPPPSRSIRQPSASSTAVRCSRTTSSSPRSSA